MMGEAAQISDLSQRKAELKQLSQKDRAELAYFLLHTLDDEVDEDAGAAWEAELNRRIADIRSGKEEGISAEDGFKEIRERLK